MFPRIINLTLLLVIKEFEDALKNYPEYPYQRAFSMPELRQKLIFNILDKLPNYYTILEEDQEIPSDPKILYSSFEEKICMEILIRESIIEIIELFRDSEDSIIPSTLKE